MRQEIYGNEGWIAGRDIYYCAPGQTLADWDSDSLEQELAIREKMCWRRRIKRWLSVPFIWLALGMVSVPALALGWVSIGNVQQVFAWVVLSVALPAGLLILRDQRTDFRECMRTDRCAIKEIKVILRNRRERAAVRID
ncbi:MAG: hypothetical protein IJS87_00170 [Rhodocyclaceae bacterium]|nr:hypothetical protein [Rhodocyclaceae bacterium]